MVAGPWPILQWCLPPALAVGGGFAWSGYPKKDRMVWHYHNKVSETQTINPRPPGASPSPFLSASVACELMISPLLKRYLASKNTTDLGSFLEERVPRLVLVLCRFGEKLVLRSVPLNVTHRLRTTERRQASCDTFGRGRAIGTLGSAATGTTEILACHRAREIACRALDVGPELGIRLIGKEHGL